jgi:large subunit ribosomal protein L10
MQTKKQKEEIVSDVTDRARASKALVFAKYTGLTVKESMELQRELRKNGASLRVMKKTLLSIALKAVGVSVDVRALDGQIVTAFSPDEVTAAKVLVKFAKKHKALVVAAGSLGEKSLSAEEVAALSKLPSLLELRAQLAGTLQAPIAGFARTLSGTLSGLARVLQRVAEGKGA